MTATPTIPGRDDRGTSPNTKGPFPKVVALLQDSNGIDIGSDNALPVTDISNLVPNKYDSIALTYVTSGNGVGEIETVTYKLSTVTVATLTLVYDINDQLSTVTKT